MNTDKPILELMEEFLMSQDIRANSRQKYRDCLKIFFTWITRYADIRNLTKQTIVAYKQYLIDSRRTPATIDNYLAPVRQFFRFLAEEDIHKNITIGVKSPRRYGYSKDHLIPEQVAELLRSIPRDSLVGKRDYAIINLMVRTGMRCVEIARADVRDLRKEQHGWVIYIQGKARWTKDRCLGITEKIVNPIIEYIEEAGLDESSPLFLNHAHISMHTRITTLTISKIVKRYLRSIGIDSRRITAHSLRHTAAITALQSGADILAVKSMLGHTNLETTMIYQRSIEAERTREGTAIRLMDSAYEIRKITDKTGQKRPQD